MEPFKLPGIDTRLIIHNGTVYKIKLIFVTRKHKRNATNLTCDSSSMQHEIEEAIRVVLLGTLTPLKTEHFIISTECKQWKLPSLVAFMKNGKQVNSNSSTLTLFVQPKEDFTNQPIEPQEQPAQSAPSIPNEKLPSDNKDHTTSHQLSPVIPRVSRKQTRSFTVKEKSLHSPSLPKKPRSSDKGSSVEDHSSSTQQDGRHQDCLLPAAKDQQHTIRKYSLRSQGEASSAKSHREKLNSRRTRQGLRSASKEVRINRQDSRAYNKGASQLHEDEPMVGATATVESLPAYPQGGVVQHHGLAQQLGRFDEEQHQLNEQMRLQRLAGNQQSYHQPPPVGHYQLRPRGTLKQMVNAVLTPVRNLFS